MTFVAVTIKVYCIVNCLPFGRVNRVCLSSASAMKAV